MGRVTGIGGVFFGRRVLGHWLDGIRIILESSLMPESYYEERWYQEAGATVFAPFAQDSDYFGRAEQQWMINLRVRDFDAVVEQLRAANINVLMDPEQYPNGRFARLYDPKRIQSIYGSRNGRGEKPFL
jgi:glyoxylase I family protein